MTSGGAAAGLVEVDLGPGVRAAFSTVDHGNVSTAHGDPGAAARARAALVAWAGVPVAWVRQVHGPAVRVVADGALPPVGTPEVLPDADASVTARRDVALAVVVADCVPLLLADATAGVVAAVHAGRRGLLAGVVDRALDAMAGLGADPARTRGAVGPCVCGRCYEVPAAMCDEAEALLPGIGSTTSWGTPALDLPGAVARVAAARGVDVQGPLGCTLEEDRWFSHRAASSGRPGRTEGRTAAVVVLDPQRAT